MATDGIAITYNGYDLQTGNIIVNAIKHKSIPTKAINSFTLARANRTAKTSSFYTNKIINLQGQIVGSNRDDLDSRVDAMKAAFISAGDSANLDIGYNTGTRRYVATVTDFTVEPSASPNMDQFTVTFTSYSPWGVSTSSTTISNAVGVTTSPSSQSITLAGNAPEQFIGLTYTLTSFTGAAYNTIYFKNNATGQQISVARTWVAADVVVIDFVNMSVKVNSIETDFDGVFFAWSSGAGTFVTTDNFTTRTYTQVLTQLPRWQ